MSLSAPTLLVQMNRTHQFKPVASKSRKTVRSSQCLEGRTSQSSKAVTVRTPTKPRRKQTRPQSSPVSLPCFRNITLLPPEFYQIDALDLAPRLLGKFLRRDNVVLQITEVNFGAFLLSFFPNSFCSSENRNGSSKFVLFGCWQLNFVQMAIYFIAEKIIEEKQRLPTWIWSKFHLHPPPPQLILIPLLCIF